MIFAPTLPFPGVVPSLCLPTTLRTHTSSRHQVSITIQPLLNCHIRLINKIDPPPFLPPPLIFSTWPPFHEFPSSELKQPFSQSIHLILLCWLLVIPSFPNFPPQLFEKCAPESGFLPPFDIPLRSSFLPFESIPWGSSRCRLLNPFFFCVAFFLSPRAVFFPSKWFLRRDIPP